MYYKNNDSLFIAFPSKLNAQWIWDCAFSTHAMICTCFNTMSSQRHYIVHMSWCLCILLRKLQNSFLYCLMWLYTVVEMKSFRCGESAWTAGFGPNAGQHTRAGMGAGEAAERPAMCQKISKHCFEIVKIYAL